MFLGKAAELPRLPEHPRHRARASAGGSQLGRGIRGQAFCCGMKSPSASTCRAPELATKVWNWLHRPPRTRMGESPPDRRRRHDSGVSSPSNTVSSLTTPPAMTLNMPRAIAPIRPVPSGAAPITAGDQRLGVLTGLMHRALQSLPRMTWRSYSCWSWQAAVILESRALIDEAAQVRRTRGGNAAERRLLVCGGARPENSTDYTGCSDPAHGSCASIPIPPGASGPGWYTAPW